MLAFFVFVFSMIGLIVSSLQGLLNFLKRSKTKLRLPSMKRLTIFAATSLFVLTAGIFLAGGTDSLMKDLSQSKPSTDQPAFTSPGSEGAGKSDTGFSDDLQVHFIDVGQADAALLQFEDKAILIDAGDWKGDEVLSYLQTVGVESLDLFIGSHEHADHIGQIDQVMAAIPVSEVWLTGNVTNSQVFEKLLAEIVAKEIAYDEPRAGDKFKIGNLYIDVISPKTLTGHLNNDSIVLKIRYGAISFLFTGDIEVAAEKRIVKSRQAIDATVLKVSHHGSDTSTSEAFLKKVDPEIAIMSVGASSQYGHPSQSVIDRIQSQGIDLYATKSHGHILLRTDGKQVEVTTEKEGEVSAGGPETERAKKAQALPKQDCIDLNRASEAELQELVHIGKSRAVDIVQQRPFQSIDQLLEINGINEARLEAIKAEGKACIQ